MEKIYLDRLDATIAMLKGLRPEQFKYTDYVSKWNEAENCGTVCCVVGWYPRFFPDAGFTWPFIFAPSKIEVVDKLAKYHGLPAPVIEALFYGYLLHDVRTGDIVVGREIHANLAKVIKRFEDIRAHLTANNNGEGTN